MPEVVFVGTGDAFGSGGRRNSAILVRDSGRTLLLDCGPTTLPGLKSMGIDPREIDAIALSHYHGDHVGGVPFLLLDYQYEHARAKPLTILGPPGVQKRVEGLSQAYEYHGHEDRSYDLVFREFSPGVPLEVDGFEVVPADAWHHPETCPHMVHVAVGGRSIFFTGDTGWHEALPRLVGDVDLFVSECVFFEERFEFHLAHVRLDRERARFRAARTILTHLGSEVLANTEKVRFDLAEDGLHLSV
jgi:ribonuclease BN (tRNA processing enzyme)